MQYLSATDVAISQAAKAGTLKVENEMGRFGPFVSISDDFGLIEVHFTAAEADARVAECVRS